MISLDTWIKWVTDTADIPEWPKYFQIQTSIPWRGYPRSVLAATRTPGDDQPMMVFMPLPVAPEQPRKALADAIASENL
jgi:hypothetical protein